MAVIHNLATITDNLSGFDPVAGVSDGTTVGMSWVLYKIYQALLAFDSNLRLITNASPTPSWLRTYAGTTIQTEPAQNRATTGDFVRLYWDNDLGLSASTPHCWVWEIRYNATITSRTKFSSNIFWVNSSTGQYNPLTVNSVSTADQSTPELGFYYSAVGATNTTMSNFPKVIFWRSSNAIHLVAIGKTDNAYQGMLSVFIPSVASAYRPTIGACTYAENIHFFLSQNNKGGMSFIEPFSQNYYESNSARSSNCYLISSCGYPPSGLFNFDSVNNLIGGKLRFAVRGNTTLILVTEEIEGVVVVNSSNAGLTSYGGISLFGGNYYLNGQSYSDGLNTFRTLYYLGA